VATRLSVSTAILATGIASIIGIPLGVGAAMLSGGFRTAALRTIDAVLAFPIIIVALFVAAIMGAGAVSATLGVGLALVPAFARVASTLSMSVGGREFVLAARVIGVSNGRLMLRHVLPNVAEPLLIQVTVAISASIVATSSLSFLGLGVQPPVYDWGRMLTEGVQSFYFTPAAALGPAAAIAIASMAFG
jgi:ABC-type dipeptide/oligopeptide/nickel transport system permease subunit